MGGMTVTTVLEMTEAQTAKYTFGIMMDRNDGRGRGQNANRKRACLHPTFDVGAQPFETLVQTITGRRTCSLCHWTYERAR